MKAQGFVEISHIKGDLLFRALLPMGIPWSQAQEALNEMSSQIGEHIKSVEEQERLKQEQEASAPVEVQAIEAEVLNS